MSKIIIDAISCDAYPDKVGIILNARVEDKIFDLYIEYSKVAREILEWLWKMEMELK